MNVSSRAGLGSIVTVTVAGEIDMATVGMLEDALREAVTRRHLTEIVVDFAGVTFCDSSGLAALDKAHAGATERAAMLRVVDPQPPIRLLFELTGLLNLLAER